MSCATHASYAAPPRLPRTTSSSQSVAGHPVTSPLSMPPHHGFAIPSAAIRSDRSMSSAHVVGTRYPPRANAFGEYQTRDFTLALNGAA